MPDIFKASMLSHSSLPIISLTSMDDMDLMLILTADEIHHVRIILDLHDTIPLFKRAYREHQQTSVALWIQGECYNKQYDITCLAGHLCVRINQIWPHDDPNFNFIQ